MLTSISHISFRATRLISSTLTASTAFSICFGVKRRPLVSTCRPMSSVIAEVPSKTDQQRHPKLALPALDLSLGRHGAHPRPLAESEMHQVAQVNKILRTKRPPTDPRLSRRSKSSFMSLRGSSRRSRGKEWGHVERAAPVAEHGLEHEHREVVWRAPPDALDCDRKVDRGYFSVPGAHLGAHKVCLRV